MSNFLSLDDEKTEFVLRVAESDKQRFDGTLNGVLEMLTYIREKDLTVSMSSDLNHPDEFPNFGEHIIDIAAGYYDGAVKAGLIRIDKETEHDYRTSK